MIRLNDPESLLPFLRSFFEKNNLPGPTAIQSLRYPELMAHYEVRFGDPNRPPLHVQVRTHDLDENGLNATYCVSKLLSKNPDLPVTPSVGILPPPSPNLTVSVCPFLQGQNGNARLRQHPQDMAQVFGLVGEVAQNLARTAFPGHGMVATLTGFLPDRTSWADSWMEHVERRVRAIQESGIEVQPLVGNMMARIDGLQQSLNDVRSWSLVHGRLSPANLTVIDENGTLQVGGLTGWENSFIGDPLAEWGNLLWLNPRPLAHVLSGYGLEAARSWLVDSALQRLEIYALTYGLQTLAEAGSGAYSPKHSTRQLLLCCRDLERLMKPNGIKQRLEQALEASPSSKDTVPSIRPDVALEAKTQLLVRIGQAPRINQQLGRVWSAATATAFLAEQPGFDATSTQYFEITDRLLEMLSTPSRAPSVRQVSEPNRWRKTLIQQTLEHHQNQTDLPIRPSLLATWMFVLLSETGPKNQASSWLRGFETYWSGLLASERGEQLRSTKHPSTLLLVDHLQSLAAVKALASRTSTEEDLYSELSNLIRINLDSAWERVGLGLSKSTEGLRDYITHYSRAETQRTLPAPVGPLFLALLELDEAELPAPHADLLKGLGFQTRG